MERLEGLEGGSWWVGVGWVKGWRSRQQEGVRGGSTGVGLVIGVVEGWWERG